MSDVGRGRDLHETARVEYEEVSLGQQKRYAPEEIIAMLREAEVRLGHGERVGRICDRFGISEQSYYRWRRQYGGLRVEQVKKIQYLEKENARLRRVIAAMAVSPR